MAKQYISEVNKRAAKPRSLRLREQGNSIGSVGNTVITTTNGSEQSNHTHQNMAALNKIGVDDENYMYLTQLKEVSEGESTDCTEKIKAGYSDEAGHTKNANNADEWDGHMFSDYIDQPIRKSDVVGFKEVISECIKSPNYIPGDLVGRGFVITKDENGNSVLEIDRAIIRKDITITELIINQISFSLGETVFSLGGFEITDVEETADGYKCFYDDKDGKRNAGMVMGDLARAQVYDASSSNVARYYWREVIGIGNGFVTLSKSSADTGSTTPQIGDNVVQFGNKSKAARQSCVVIDARGGGAIEMYKGINSFSLANKIYLGMGNNSSTDESFSFCYGNFYFGARDGSKYITYRKNESGEDELLINAKVIMGAGSSGLSNLTEWTNEKNNLKTEISNVQTTAKDALSKANEAISEVVTKYYLSTSKTALIGGEWLSTPPTWVDGKYMWTKNITTYIDGEDVETDVVCIAGAQGAKGETGAAGISITGVTNYYQLSTSGTTSPTGTWATTPPTLTASQKYLWNYEVVTYSSGNPTTTAKRVIGVYGDKGATGAAGTAGKGISSIVEYYLANSSASGVTTSTSGWTTTMQYTTTTNKYLWNYEVVTYTDNTKYTSTPIIIGTHGATGAAAVVYSIQPSDSSITKSTTGELSTSTILCTKYKTTGNTAKVVTTEKTLKYQRIGVDSSEIAYSGAITITNETTAIIFTLYDGSTILDRERVPVLSDASDLEVGTVNLLRHSSFSLATQNEERNYSLWASNSGVISWTDDSVRIVITNSTSESLMLEILSQKLIDMGFATGDTATFTIRYKCSSNNARLVLSRSTQEQPDSVFAYTIKQLTLPYAEDYDTYYVTFIIDDITAAKYALRLIPRTIGESIDVKNASLVKGNVPLMTWQPTIEDITSDISKLGLKNLLLSSSFSLATQNEKRNYSVERINSTILSWTDNSVHAISNTSIWDGIIIRITSQQLLDLGIKEGEPITLTSDCKCSNERGFFRIMRGTPEKPNAWYSKEIIRKSFSASGDYATNTVTFIPDVIDAVTNIHYGLAFTINEIGENVDVKNASLVKGTVPLMIWEPAPQDITNGISSAQSAAEAANQALSLINDDEYFALGEKKIMRREWFSIHGLNDTTSVANSVGSYAQAIAVVSGTNVSTSIISAAYEGLKTYFNAVQLYASSDFKFTSTYTRQMMSDKLTAYYNAYQTLYDELADYYAINYTSGDNIVVGANQYTASTPLTLTATKSDYITNTDIKVYLENGKTYFSNIETDGTWGSSNAQDTVESFLLKNKSLNEYFYLTKTNYVFTHTKSTGWYYFRVDVNLNGSTHSFWNFQVREGKAIMPYAPNYKEVTDALNTYVDGAFKDGVITLSEAKQIRELSISDKAAIDTTFGSLSANNKLSTTTKSNLNSSYNTTYVPKYTALIAACNNIIAAATITTALTSALSTAYTAYLSARTSLMTNLQTCQKEIDTAIDNQSAEMQANINESKAITDGFTTTDGGLVMTNLLYMRDMDKSVTSGLSGVQGGSNDMPAAWFGGTYAEAIANTAGSVFRHDKTAKIGNFFINADGTFVAKDSSNKARVVLKNSAASLNETTDATTTTTTSGSATLTGVSIGGTSATNAVKTYTGTLSSVPAGAVISISNATITANASSSVASSAVVALRLRCASPSLVVELGSVTASGTTINSKTINTNYVVSDAGTYYLDIIYSYSNGGVEGSDAKLSYTKSTTTTVSTVPKVIIGSNGIVISAPSAPTTQYRTMLSNSDSAYADVVRVGNFGLQHTSSGMKRMTKGSVWKLMPEIYLMANITYSSSAGAAVSAFYNPMQAVLSVSRTAQGKYTLTHNLGTSYLSALFADVRISGGTGVGYASTESISTTKAAIRVQDDSTANDVVSMTIILIRFNPTM